MTADLQRQADRAAAELARRLRPFGLMKDPEGFAARFLADMLAEHWRRIPPPPDWRASVRRPTPDVAHRGAEAARQALKEAP